MAKKQDEIVPGMAEAIEDRRKWARLTPRAFADAAGVTPQGLMAIRKGYRRNYQDKLKLGVAAALEWPHDAIDRLLAGEDPTTFGTVHRVESREALERELAVVAEQRARQRQFDSFEAYFRDRVQHELGELGYPLQWPPTAGGVDLWADVGGRRLLIEAKVSTTTPDLRSAIGQVLQYRHWARRNLGQDDVVVTVVLPEDPGREWNEIFEEANVVVTWPSSYERLIAALPPADARVVEMTDHQGTVTKTYVLRDAAERAADRELQDFLEAASSGEPADDEEPRTSRPTGVPEEPDAP